VRSAGARRRIWMATDEIDEHQWEFLRSRELVLYCS
jgi:hypothetical protein